jgi:ubiquinone/menaquinone biosynthesis C-methylase UbiE
MIGYKPQDSFNVNIAKEYANIKRGDEIQAVKFLNEIADGANCLELAVGTGRLALPLYKSGAKVDGIDFSSAMLDQLRLQKDGDKIELIEGNIVDFNIGKKYKLIYIVWNSFFNILEQEKQIACFHRIAKHLLMNGSFVIEAYVPDFLFKLDKEQYVNSEQILPNQIKFDILRHNSAKQIIEENHVSINEEGVHFNPVVQRYVWPSELDLMAKLSGMKLKNRWGGWDKKPFDSKCELHVSEYILEN